MISNRSRLAVSAAVLAAAMLLPLAANAAPKLSRIVGSAPVAPSVSAAPKGGAAVLGYGYYWRFVDYLRYWKNHRGQVN